MPRSQLDDHNLELDNHNPTDYRSGAFRAPTRPNAKKHLKLIASIASQLSSIGPNPLSTAILLSLSCRGLMPKTLVGTPAGQLVEQLSTELFALPSVQIDHSELANCLMETAARAEENLIDVVLLEACQFEAAEQLFETFKSIATTILPPEVRQTLADPLFCGWLYQTILIGRNDYSLSRKRKSPEVLSRITQWFTPEWICTFLLQECFRERENLSSGSSPTTTFLDSACGAGHILSPALRKLLARRLIACRAEQTAATNRQCPGTWQDTLDQTDDSAAIKLFEEHEIDRHLPEVLASQLFGLDIDPLMVRLSGLSIYLTCRDLTRTAPLPIPALFSFCDRSESYQTKSSISNLPNSNSEGLNSQRSRSQRPNLPESNAASKLAGLNTANMPQSNANHGSLLLGLNPRAEDVLLRRIDGTTMTLSALPNTFDLQTLNPPYLSHRLMSDESARFLRKHYDGNQYDYYTAFLELSIRLMAPEGRLALICQQSFLSTSRFEELRRRLLERCHIKSVVQLGAGAFASRGGEKVSNAIIALSLKNGNEDAQQLSVYKLVSALAKQRAETDGLHEYLKKTYSESELRATTGMIPGFPIVPFCPKEVALLFQTYQTIANSNNGIVLTNGLFTCDNKRFVRHFLEMGDCDRSSFVPYDKGGGQKWFSTTPYMLEWTNNGEQIRQFRLQQGQSQALPGERFYFQQGITYSYIGTKGFKARLLSPGSVFDIASSSMFSEQIDLYYLLGFLNSSLTRFILGMLNPTINFQIGDLRRIPFCPPHKETELAVARFAKEAVELAREAERFDPVSPSYDRTITSAHTESRVASINRAELQLQNGIDSAIFDLYKISNSTRDLICENEWVARTQISLVPPRRQNNFEQD